MAKAIDIQVWRGRINKALSLQATKHSEWKQNIDFYTGDWFKNNVGEDAERIEVSFVFSFIKTLIPAIYYKDPYIFAKARSSLYQMFGETMEEVINYAWNDLKLRQEIKHVVLDAALSPPGWLKMGYMAEFGEDVADLTKAGDSGFIKKIIERLTQKRPDKTAFQEGVLSEEIREESVFAQYISSWRMLMAPGYHRVKNMPYLIEIEDIAIEDLVKNRMYKSSKNNVKPTRSTSIPTSSSIIVAGIPNLSSGDSKADMTRLFHVWDRRGQVRFTVAEGLMNEKLFEGDWPYSAEGFPYRPLIFNDVPQTDKDANPYPVSDIKSMSPQLVELSQVRTQMVKHRKRSGTVIFVRKGQFTSDEIANFEDAEDLSILEVTSMDANTIKEFQPPALPQDVYRINDVILQDLMRESGLLQLLTSSPQRGIETLGEARIIQQGSELRTSDKVSIIEDYTIEVSRYLASLLWEFYDRRKVGEILGREIPEEAWPDLPDDKSERRRIIQSEIQFKIEAGATRPPVDDFVDRKLWQQEVATMKQLFPNKINDDVILEQWLKKLKVKDIERAIIRFDNEEAQVAQEENGLLEKDIPQFVSPNENHEIHMPIHMQGQMTKAKQLHILEHHKWQQMRSPMKAGQGGNAMTQNHNTPAEFAKGGSPTGSDLVGAAENLGKGIGESGPT